MYDSCSLSTSQKCCQKERAFNYLRPSERFAIGESGMRSRNLLVERRYDLRQCLSGYRIFLGPRLTLAEGQSSLLGHDVRQCLSRYQISLGPRLILQSTTGVVGKGTGKGTKTGFGARTRALMKGPIGVLGIVNIKGF